MQNLGGGVRTSYTGRSPSPQTGQSGAFTSTRAPHAGQYFVMGGVWNGRSFPRITSSRDVHRRSSNPMRVTTIVGHPTKNRIQRAGAMKNPT